jgi:AcrR family transcriptional regulator
MLSTGTGRTNQKARTRTGIVEACRTVIRSGAPVTMPDVARAALVSEATAYRYFPDLVSLLTEAMDGLWLSPAEALAPVAGSTDPRERVTFAAEFLLRGVLSYQGSVRAMIANTVDHPERAGDRPGLRFGLLDTALAPWADSHPDAVARLKLDLAVIVGAEALFVLIDQCGLSPEEAIASITETASRLVTAADLTPPQPPA